MYPTVSQVLALPAVRRGAPAVVAGAAGLPGRVRWVHAAEIADIATLLHGGELVLTTGIALPDDPVALTRYVDELADVGASGLVVELVRHWDRALPAALAAAAERRGLPLVSLARETRFVAVTEAVVGLIVDAQLAELRAAEEVHEAFTALTVSGAEPAEVLREVVRSAGMPVVLETLGHDVLAYDTAGGQAAELLADWSRRSKAVALSERTGYHADAGWLVTVVGARGNDWGRLVLLCPGEPAHRHVVIAERAASALALHRLAAREREGLERHAHRTLLTELLATAAPPDLVARSAALGVPLQDRLLVGVCVRPSSMGTAPAMATAELLRDLAEATALAVRRARVSALVGIVDDTSVRALLSLTPAADSDSVLRRLSQEFPHPVVLAAGTTARGVAGARRSLVEAAHVAQAALRSAAPKPFHRLSDVRLRGLLHLLADDDRVAAFADRELGALVERDAAHGSRLLETLRHYCAHGGNKSAAAAAAHMSRTAYYQQLARIEQVLGVSLEDAESVQSLHVALLAWEIREQSDWH
ncbi:PucR family transcriptional regulator [Actinokineospora bangkokensis]|uniref:CdaR family transcriptional regulator n=1 Tax=Actinokineospora bangkokensis TaxID=1193682 RepID=A0A1Q9LSM4_9PSEU|nr:PucR family transcriptional regulator [Actinokineospora bangkokensis]OLR95001.1 CdaR family transcriptional regulator [Actinokineospora bangkokensis]